MQLMVGEVLNINEIDKNKRLCKIKSKCKKSATVFAGQLSTMQRNNKGRKECLTAEKTGGNADDAKQE